MFLTETSTISTDLSFGSSTPKWYAVYTRARHEKQVAEQLASRAVQSFLPLYRSVHRWNDRSRVVELPLLAGYLFVRIAIQDRLRVLQIPSVVRLLSYGGLPMALPDHEIEQFRLSLDASLRMEPHPYLRVGSRVRVRRGPFEGTEGYVVRNKNVFRVVISLHLLLRSIAVELDAADLDPIPETLSYPQGTFSRSWASSPA